MTANVKHWKLSKDASKYYTLKLLGARLTQRDKTAIYCGGPWNKKDGAAASTKWKRGTAQS